MKLVSKGLLLILLLCGALAPRFAVADGQAKSRLDEIRAGGVLRVGTTGDYVPFTFKDPKTGRLDGFDIEEARRLAKALGVRLEIVMTSWPTLTADFRAGRFDIAMGGVTITDERREWGLFSAPYMLNGKAAIAHCGEAGKFQTLDGIDRPEVRVIVNPGGTNEKFVRGHLKRAQVISWKDNKSIFDALAAGKADLMITDAIETRRQQKLHPGVLCAAGGKPLSADQKGYWIQRDPALADFVSQWMQRSRNDGSFQTLYDEWLN